MWEGGRFENTEMLETSERHSKGVFDNQASQWHEDNDAGSILC